ncbi:hypothetical protein GN244_ATG20723 [Phytophthora infestans]|uniref:Uncharacterized protein n=1 Tax=Phytophthora infestans TaxID=4787 RepID=A0A833S5M4_PHYIN|nr:hypothetical protein GN244_ATG20723 [Phytophthora infestans]
MRKEALTPASASCDESLRTWTAREPEILMMYLAGNLDLPYPPSFVKEIMTGEHRAMLEDMHEAYFNANLTAARPASVNMHHMRFFSKNFSWLTLTGDRDTRC